MNRVRGARGTFSFVVALEDALHAAYFSGNNHNSIERSVMCGSNMNESGKKGDRTLRFGAAFD